MREQEDKRFTKTARGNESWCIAVDPKDGKVYMVGTENEKTFKTEIHSVNMFVEDKK